VRRLTSPHQGLRRGLNCSDVVLNCSVCYCFVFFFVTVFETFVTVFDFFVTVFAGFVTAFALYWGLGFMKTVRPEPLAEWFNEVSSMRGAERSELSK
jgi:cytosine/uracil/thiamine/allantoin permease